MSKRKRTPPPICTRISWRELDPQYLHHLVALARDEDTGGAGLARRPEMQLDVTTALLNPEGTGSAALVARKRIRVAGLHLIPIILKVYGGDVDFTPAVRDGASCEPGAVLGQFSGSIRTLLTAERVLLNFLQRLSGVATTTAAYVAALGETQTRILDTRKTTPGFRMLEKYAVTQGGGWNHRLGLFDRVMLKDNHLAASGAVGGDRLRDAVSRALDTWPDLLVEVEVDRVDQIPPVIEAGADIILLDNFSLTDLKEALAIIGDEAATEASGGITLETLPELGGLGLDFISTGALTHASNWVDIGLDWEL